MVPSVWGMSGFSGREVVRVVPIAMALSVIRQEVEDPDMAHGRELVVMIT